MRAQALACALFASALEAVAQTPHTPQVSARPDNATIARRASEGGAWWLLMQATCVPDVSEKTRGDLSRALASVRSGEIAALVGARIDEPRLDEESRKRMEQIMSLAAGMARQLTEMTDVRARLKPGPNPTTAFQRRGWRIQHPIQSAADLDRAIADTQGILAKMCMDGLTGVNATLLDETRGLMRLIK